MKSPSKIECEEYFKKYGKDNFDHTRLRFFRTRQEAFDFEEKFIRIFKLHLDNRFYNATDSVSGNTLNKVIIKSINGNTILDKNSDEYKNGKYESITKGKVLVKDKEDNKYQVDIKDSRYLSGELVGIQKGMVSVKHIITGETMSMSKEDSRYLSGEYIGVMKGITSKLKHKSKPHKKGLWSWNKAIKIKERNQTAKYWAIEFNTTIPNLKNYLIDNNIEYEIIKGKKKPKCNDYGKN